MTKFTSEFIAEARSSITETGVERYICIPVQIEMLDEIERLQSRIAELEEFKMIVEGCGFEVITEPPVLNHPERKILKGHGTIYVPELPEPPEVK